MVVKFSSMCLLQGICVTWGKTGRGGEGEDRGGPVHMLERRTTRGRVSSVL